MKSISFFLLLTLLQISCSTAHRIPKSEDTSRAVKSMEMTDKLSAYPAGMNGKKASQERVSIKTVHRFDVGKDGKANLSVEFLSAKFISDSKSDSVVYLILDGERIGVFQRSDSRFEVPENLWVSIANCSKIEYFLKIGKEEFEIRPNQAQTKNLKYFFERANEYSDASSSPHPEGMKKW